MDTEDKTPMNPPAYPPGPYRFDESDGTLHNNEGLMAQVYDNPGEYESLALGRLLSAAPELLNSVETLTFMLLHLCEALDLDESTAFKFRSKGSEEVFAEITIGKAAQDATERVAKALGREDELTTARTAQA